jgi:hypothetical protein
MSVSIYISMHTNVHVKSTVFKLTIFLT